jgi:mannose-1-phosphate guanylyltransferase
MNNPSGGRVASYAILPKLNTVTASSGQDRWAVILAGGDGSRLLPLTRKIAGDDRPKQFCPIINGNTLLDETRRRVALALSPGKTMFVLTRKHANYYHDALAGVPRGNLVVQPRNAGTTPAILYSLLRLEQINAAATAAFFPSDHYFSDDRAFMSEVELAFAAANQDPNSIVLLGIEPEGPDEEYGWIEPERESSLNSSGDLWRVRRFWEKPSPALARELMERGCLWNSFVMVGAVSAFLKMIRHATSGLYTKFTAVRSKLSTASETNAMEIVYADLRDSNFSREVLQTRPADLLVCPVRGSKWSDLGNPRRVFSTLAGLGAAPSKKHEPAHLMVSTDGYYGRARVRSSEIV